MTDWLERLLKQAAYEPEHSSAAPEAAQALKDTASSGAPVSREDAAQGELTAGALAAELLREELRLGTPTAPAAAEGANWLAEPLSPKGRTETLPSPSESGQRFDPREIDRAFERDARRYDGSFSLYE